jgi:hypothetical protein
MTSAERTRCKEGNTYKERRVCQVIEHVEEEDRRHRHLGRRMDVEPVVQRERNRP